MPKLTWYIHRLRAMSPAEVGYRLRHSAQARVDRARLNRDRLPGTELPEPLEPMDVPFFFDPARREEIRATWAREYPEGRERLRAEADELLAGRVRVFDREMSWEETPNWHLDLLNGREWPRCFWAEMPIRDGGVKYVWELARHQHLMTLARAWFLLDEQPYGTAACRWLKSWIDENPPYTGVHWTSALELALRLIAWSWIYRLLRGHPAWTGDLARGFFQAIQLQVEFIRRYHSAHSSANNHLIGEAAGVATAGLAFPWLADADRWRHWGLQLLADELPRQCHPDGVSAEQTFHYQAFVMDLALQPTLLNRHQGRETPVEVLDRLEVMAEFLSTAMDASGHLPSIGDADDGAAIRLGQDLHSPYRSLLATCGVLFNRPEFCRAAGSFDEKSAWLLGPGGRDRFTKLSEREAERTVVRCRLGVTPGGLPLVSDSQEFAPGAPSRTGSRQFAHGGYTVLRCGERDGEQLLVMDHGPLGYLSLAAHGHADCLSLVWHVGGHPVLIDPGTYTYHEQPEWRAFFRGTPAHNTVTVDGQHQSVMTGPTMWGHRATPRVRTWVTQPQFDFVEAEHDGYQRLPGRPLHRRAVFHSRGGATFVVDQLLGDGTHEGELNWHFAAGTHLQNEEDAVWVARAEGVRCGIALLADTAPNARVVEGQEEPPQGWVSSEFGAREPAPVLTSRRAGSLPIAWTTLLLPPSVLGEPWRARPTVAGRVDTRGAVVTLESAGGRDLYAQSFEEAETLPEAGKGTPDGHTAGVYQSWLDLGHGRFRGRAAHLRFDATGKLATCCLVGGVELEWEGRRIWQASAGPEDACFVPEEATPDGDLSAETDTAEDAAGFQDLEVPVDRRLTTVDGRSETI
jgi:hypothetical protein